VRKHWAARVASACSIALLPLVALAAAATMFAHCSVAQGLASELPVWVTWRLWRVWAWLAAARVVASIVVAWRSLLWPGRWIQGVDEHGGETCELVIPPPARVPLLYGLLGARRPAFLSRPSSHCGGRQTALPYSW
jgi:hypothetical protein